MHFPNLSPDGPYMALANGPESDRDVWIGEEIFLTPHPDATQRRDVSRGSGSAWPRWRGDGKESCYTTDDAIVVVQNWFAEFSR